MAEKETSAGGVKITVGEKTTGQKMAEAAPFYGGYLKTSDALKKANEDGGGEWTSLTSEGVAFLGSIGSAASSFATDPIGFLVGQGLNFLISVVQPLEDAIHMVSGDGPALQQASENFGAIAKGVAELRTKFDEELQNTVKTWGGDAAEVASTKLGEFGNGIEGVAGQAGEMAQLLQLSSMVMTIVEDVIKAILTELITWLIMIWIPALAAAVPSFGSSTAAAGAATGVRVATTGSRVSRIVARLRQLLSKIMEFLRNLGSRFKNVGTAFKRSMANKQVGSVVADGLKAGGDKSWGVKLWSKDGMIGERVQHGFTKSMGGALVDEAKAQLFKDKAIRNGAAVQKANDHDGIGGDYEGTAQQKQRIEGYLDI
ncbi:WXG100 family type VII secretion target [Lentzea sp. HUAS TT2]|uniref:WXG100 family type VII secretion target n=1 Tax=Lentzea sp. HUAS TT2 TaxID=3447454 RepID=UPI003F7044B6